MPKDAGGAEKKARRRRKRRESYKGALIKGMTRRIPIQLLGDLSFQEGLEKIMRGYAGFMRSIGGNDSTTLASRRTSTIAFAGTRRTSTRTNGTNSRSSACAGFTI